MENLIAGVIAIAVLALAFYLGMQWQKKRG